MTKGSQIIHVSNRNLRLTSTPWPTQFINDGDLSYDGATEQADILVCLYKWRKNKKRLQTSSVHCVIGVVLALAYWSPFPYYCH